jgi:hypothetical protein
MTGPLLEDRLAQWALRLLPDLPKLGNAWWTLEFYDPTASGTKKRQRVNVELKQFGSKIQGLGYLYRQPEDRFSFEGRLRRNVFQGTFQRDDHHVLAGTGSFVLKILAHSRQLQGYCLWYDGLLDQVWASEYHWKRK